MVLAGGEGKRLWPLTADRAKPAVPFGGIYRLVDFVLSNLVNAELGRIVVLTQYKSHSLNRHISLNWRMSSLMGDFVTPVPAQQRLGPKWFAGSADAIYQSLNLVYDENPAYVVVFGADHVYRMDARQMIEQHIASGAGVTVAALRAPREQSGEFGVINSADGRVIDEFLEKPTDPPGLADDPDSIRASMGNYVFTTSALLDAVKRDAYNEESNHDLGGDVIPALVASGDAQVYDFADNKVPGATERDAGYWRDVGTIDAYYQTSMDLIQVEPILNLYDRDWPIHTYQPPMPPPKFVHSDPDRKGAAYNSVVCQGAIVSGGQVHGSILSPEVRINSFAQVEDSILFDGVEIGRHARVRRAIIDKEVKVPPHFEIGWNREADLARGLFVTEGGITIVAKAEDLERFSP
jgi:glucose-1-phosphate adenylyltransferase